MAPYADSLPQAEAQKDSTAQKTLFSETRTKTLIDDDLTKAARNPFAQDCADGAEIWAHFMKQAKDTDGQAAKILNSELDPLLIFAGLFSGILSAFLIEVRKGLQEDLQDITNQLLTTLILVQQNASASALPSSTSHFEPGKSTRWVNGLWFTSLLFSLLSALSASLAKAWVTEYSSFSFQARVHWTAASSRHTRFLGVQRWHLETFIHCLPMLIHASVFLFAAGLDILLLDDDVGVGSLMMTLSAISLALYIASTAHSVWCSDSPFRTPLSVFIRWGFKMNSQPPTSDDDVSKAEALGWLLVTSADATVTENCVRAIAGLPATPEIQNRLSNRAVISILKSGLSDLMQSDAQTSSSLLPYLYAICRLVQTKRQLTHSEDSNVSLLSSIVQQDGPLYHWKSLERGVQEVAIYVKARIVLFVDESNKDQDLFRTDIPIMINSSPSLQVSQLLQEVHILSSGDFAQPIVIPGRLNTNNARAAPGPSIANSLLCGLQSPDALEQKHCHTILLAHAQKAASEANNANSSFCTKTLGNGLVSDSSNVQERALQALHRLLPNDKAKKTLVDDGIVAKIIGGFTSPQAAIRRGVVLIHGRLIEENSPWNAIVASEIMGRVMDPDPLVQNSAIDTVNKLARCDQTLLMSLVAPTGLGAIMTSFDDANPYIRVSAIRFFIKLIEIKSIRVKYVNLQVVDSITKTLKDDDPYVRKLAVEAIFKLVEYDNIIKLLADSGMNNAMIGWLEQNWSLTVGLATEVIVELAKNRHIRASFLTVGIVQRIVSKMSVVRLSAICVNAIAELAEHDDVQSALANAETIDTILLAFSSNIQEVRRGAIHAIIKLSAQKDSRLLICAPGRIGKVFRMIGDYDPDVRTSVIQAVEALVRHGDIHEMLTTPEVTDILIENLKTYGSYGWFTWWNQQLALKVIFILARHPLVRTMLATTGILNAVVEKLEDEDWDIQQPAIDALEMLAYQQDGIFASLMTPEVIKKHVDKLEDREANGQVAAIKIFVKLADNNETHAAVAASENIDRIVGKFNDQYWLVRKSAIDALIDLAKHKDIRPLLTTPARMSKLLKQIEDANPDVRESAIKTLVHFANYKEARDSLGKSECLSSILSIHRHTETSIRLAAFGVIVRLADYGDVRTTFIKPEGVVDAVIAKFKDDDRVVREAAIKAVVLLAKHEDIRALLRTSEASIAIMAKLWDAKSDVRTSAIEAMVQLADYEDIRRAIITPETISAILGQFKSGKATVPSAALNGLKRLAKHDELSKAIVNAKVVSAIIDTLNTPNTITEQEYIAALTVLMPITTVERVSHLIDIEVREDPAVGKVILQVLLALSKKHADQRRIICNSHLCDKLVQLLDRRDTRDDTMDAIREFAKIDDLRDAMKRSNVILTLLEMLKCVVDDIDGWCIGAEGLSALGLF